MTAADTPLTADAEFASLLTPLTPQEQGLLAASLKAEGCRDPIVIWKGSNVILDGHARWKFLLSSPTISFTVEEVEFATREQAREFVLRRQLGRRNLPPLAHAYYRGSLYRAAAKKPGARTDKATADGKRSWASDTVASGAGVDESTVRRDARLACQLDAVAAQLGQPFRTEVLCGRARLTRVDIARLAKMCLEEKKRYVAAKEATREEARLARRKRTVAAKAQASGTTDGNAGKSDGTATPKPPVRPGVIAPRVSEPAPYPPGAPATQPAARSAARPAVTDDDVAGIRPMTDTAHYTPVVDDDAIEAISLDEAGPNADLLGKLYALWLTADDVTKLAFLGQPYVRALLGREQEVTAAAAKAGVLV